MLSDLKRVKNLSTMFAEHYPSGIIKDSTVRNYIKYMRLITKQIRVYYDNRFFPNS